MASDLQSSIASTHTLEEFVSRRYEDQITFRNLSILEVVDGEEWFDNNLIVEYLPEIKSICIDVEMDANQYRKYKYHPDLLAYDIYGSTQLDFMILLLNDMIDPKEFDSYKVKLPYVDQIQDVLSKIYNTNAGYLEQNRIDNGLFFY